MRLTMRGALGTRETRTTVRFGGAHNRLSVIVHPEAGFGGSAVSGVVRLRHLGMAHLY